MTAILSTELAAHSFNDKWLFTDLTIGISKGQKVALVGANGAGKSTFLKILGGILVPQQGKMVRERGLRTGYLEQNPDFSGNEFVADYIYSADNQNQALIREYEELVDSDTGDSQRLDYLVGEISNLNAWEYEYQIKTILSQLAIRNFDQRIETLSGGQRKRLALAKLLIDEPDVYILDEPTNHLDIEMIEWLENFLTTANKTVIMVTHDRYFLDNVCNRIIEIVNGKTYNYDGNYGFFLERKAERSSEEASAFQKNSNLLKKELEWMRRQPQARGTKSKSRIDAFYELKDKTTLGDDGGKLSLEMKIARQGNQILELQHVKKSFQHPVIQDFSYVFKKGDRIGLAGTNGSGKSTFLNLLTGVVEPDTGIIRKGETTVFGYYRQDGLAFNKTDKVIDVVKNVAEYITVANGALLTASQLLTHFLFPPARQHSPVSVLSGGELKRLQLMRILMLNPNFLILDEPTNDLDIDTLNVLEDFLEKYNGVLLLVSHDRYLMDRLCDQLFILKNENIVIYNGNYSDYRLQEKGDASRPNVITKKTTKTAQLKQTLSYKEQKELESLDDQIPVVEYKINSLSERLSETVDFNELDKLSSEIATMRINLDKLTERWMHLTELKDLIS